MITGMLSGRLGSGDCCGRLGEDGVSIMQLSRADRRTSGADQTRIKLNSVVYGAEAETSVRQRVESEIPGRDHSVRKRGVVAVAQRDGLFLAIRRGRTVRAGGRVCFPGGHVEAGEEEHEAVVRECREELAAQVEARACVWRSVTSWGTSLAWWTVALADDGELVPDPIEVDEIFWRTAEELLAVPDLLEGNREFLEAVIRGELRVM